MCVKVLVALCWGLGEPLVQGKRDLAVSGFSPHLLCTSPRRRNCMESQAWPAWDCGVRRRLETGAVFPGRQLSLIRTGARGN